MSTEDDPPSRHKPDLTESTATIPSDSEKYSSSQHDLSPSPEPSPEISPQERTSPLILYSPPTFWSLLRGAAINLLLPFVNGLMLGFGELLAHEAAFRLGWSNTKVSVVVSSSCHYVKSCNPYADLRDGQIFPHHRRNAHAVGPGIEVRENPTSKWQPRGQSEDLDDLTALE